MIVTVTPEYRPKEAGIVPACTTACRGYSSVAESVKVDFAAGAAVLPRLLAPLSTASGVVVAHRVILSVQAGVVQVITLADALTDDFKTFVMNTRTGGMAEYTNCAFTSLFKLGTEFFALTADGLVALTGSTDAGVEISGEVLTGVSDLNVPLRKQFVEALVEGRGSEVALEVILNERTDTAVTYEQDFSQNGTEEQFHRIKLSRGVDGTHIQLRFRNLNGQPLALHTLRLPYTTKSRTTGGRR